MSDEVKAVAKEILDRTEGQIGTHSTDCHKYHLACFAAFVADALEAAQQTPVTINGRTVTYNEEDGYWWAESEGAPGWTAVANSRQELDVLTNEAKGLVEVAVDREALAAVIHERFNMARGRGGVAPAALAEQIFASGILQDAAEVEARGLERLIESVTDDGLVQVFGGEKFVSVALLVSEARAQQVRESGNSNPETHDSERSTD